jgi:superfamily II DNA/RNA helicase
MFFSNKTDAANFVHKFLQENYIKSCLFHSSMKDNERDVSIQQFYNGECNIISCTYI